VSVGAERPPELESPAAIMKQLLERVRAEEVVYLDSKIRDHRWGADSFDDVKEEFKYKTIWVAKLLRDVLGSPDPSAFIQALDRFDLGLLAAAWWSHGRVAFVSLRQAPNLPEAIVDPRRFVVVLGVAEPTPGDLDPGGDEARVAAGMVNFLIH
jgi:hypothetical protein